MPNWVSNSLSGYTNDLYEKYSNMEDKENPMPIDFNKIIPEPEEITNTISGSINDDVKKIVEFRDWEKEVSEKDKFKYDSPLYTPLKSQANNAASKIGYKAIENPDKSLNQIAEDDKYISSIYKDYTDKFGNKDFNRLSNEEFFDSCEKYCEIVDKRFKEFTNLENFNSVEEYGRHLNYLMDKYGVDNWYDWRNMHWGTKWNAKYTDYDPESEQVTFDTAWSVPEPIFAKMAEDNPDKKLEIYSEEETGWFVESEIKDGNFYETASGEITYNEEDDSTSEEREEYNPPKLMTYNDIIASNKAYQDHIHQTINNLL